MYFGVSSVNLKSLYWLITNPSLKHLIIYSFKLKNIVLLTIYYYINSAYEKYTSYLPYTFSLISFSFRGKSIFLTSFFISW